MSKQPVSIISLLAAVVLTAGLLGCSGSGGETDALTDDVQEDASVADGGGDVTDDAALSCDSDKDCAADNICVIGTCDKGACVFENTELECDDGDPCTLFDECKEGVCAGELRNCDDGLFCTGPEVCDPETGACVQDEWNDGLDDGIECTKDECDEESDEIVHLADDALCDDDNLCTTDACHVEDGCVYHSVDGPCNDLDECTEGDSCVDGECVPGEWTCGEISDNQEDDDGDDLVDCDDEDCEDALPCQPVPETETDCGNEWDDDQDGDVDCDDEDCDEAEECLPAPETETNCGNDKDDDLDGDVDCDDEDCTDSVACTGVAGDVCEIAMLINDGNELTAADAGVLLEYDGTTIGASDDYAGPCDDETAGSADVVYELKVGDNLAVTLTHDFESYYWPAVYVMDDACQENAVIGCAAANSSDAAVLTVYLVPGTYYVVLDASYKGDEEAFSFSVQVDLPPDTELSCKNGLDDDLDGLTDCDDDECKDTPWCLGMTGEDCDSAIPVKDGEPATAADIGTELVYEGTTIDMFNDYAGPCDDATEEASDVVYKLVTEAPLLVNMSQDFDGVGWPALYIFAETCGQGQYMGCDAENSAGAAQLSVALPPGTYFIVLDAAFSSDEEDYVFTISFDSPPDTETACMDGLDDDLDGDVDCNDDDCAADPGCLDPYEPNNSMEMAFDLGEIPQDGFESKMGTILLPGEDDDWFVFTVKDQGFIQIDGLTTAELDLQVYLLDSNGDELAKGDSGSKGDDEQIQAGVDGGETLYLHLKSWLDGTGEYSFSIAWTPPADSETDCANALDDDLDGAVDCDDDECAGAPTCGGGDTCDTALPINEGETITEADDGLELEYKGTTVDYVDDYSGTCSDESDGSPDAVWTFKLQAGMNVVLTHDFDSFYYPALYVRKDACDGEEMACATNKSEAAVISEYFEPGTYYVFVDADFEGDDYTYTLTAHFSAKSDTEIHCDNGIDDDADGFKDCQDTDCTGAEICQGESCSAPLLVNDGEPISAADDGLNLEYEGSTVGMTGDYSGSCDEDSAEAADAVWMFKLQDPMKVTISHDFLEGLKYPAVYVFSGDCTADNEVGCANETSDAAVIDDLALQPGAYYVVVDAAWEGDESEYALVLSFSVPPTEETECGDGKDDDGDGKVDCCDEDCLGDDQCFEFDCGDGVDNDCDGKLDCDDDECLESGFCITMDLPHNQDFENGGIWPDGYATQGPDDECEWALYEDEDTGAYSMKMKYGFDCSEEESYNLYTPWLDVSGCNEISVQFDQEGMFLWSIFWHGLGMDDGIDPTVVDLPDPEEEWAQSEVYTFDTTGLDEARVFFAYMGDNADNWWIDNVSVTCTKP